MKNTVFIPEQRTPHFYLPSHLITCKQDLSHLKERFSKEDLKTFLSLYSKAQSNPKKTLKEVKNFQTLHPDHPEVLNLLTYLLVSRKKIRQGNHLIERNFQKNPDYLLARINYADLCLRRKKAQKIPELFNNKLNLKEFCPQRKSFHISEFRGFTTMMGHYYLQSGEGEAAECCLYLAHKIAPHHPSTKLLEKKLYYTPFYKRLFSKLLKR
ncbi:MAG: hypothetical protein KDK76_07100 [Chlamydiia bacterium]|nr:hypothetical protein [Chlamydiia bacterium]